MPPRELLHSHICENCGAEYSHKAADGNWLSLHTCPVCKIRPCSNAVPVARAFPYGLKGVREMPRDRFGRWYPASYELGEAVCVCGSVYCECNCCEYLGPGPVCKYTGGGASSGSSGSSGYGGTSGYGGSPAQDANSTAAGGNLPATGQPAPGAPGGSGGSPATAPGTTPSFVSNLTNFSTPWPYVAIGGVILAAALLTGPGSKGRSGSLPSPIIL